MAVVAVLLWLVFLVVPGFGAARLVARSSPAVALGVSAPVSVAIFYLIGQGASRLDLPVMLCSGLAAALVTVAWLAIEFVGWRRLRARRDTTPARVAPEPPVVWARALLVAGIGAGIVLWEVLHSRLTVPVGWDAMHHGYFVRQILDHDTLKQSVVLSSDPGRADGTVSFYPLGINLLTAILHASSGIPISTLIQASEVAAAGVILPVGVYALTRELAPELPLAAGFAALFSVFPANLFVIEITGRITAVIGLAFVPSAVLGMVRLPGAPAVWRAAVLAFLSIVGLTGVHTSEVPEALGMAFVVMLTLAWRARRWPALGKWLAYVVTATVAAGVALWIADPRITNISNERSGSFRPPGHDALFLALGHYLVLPGQSFNPNERPMAVWSFIVVAGCLVSVLPRFRALIAPALCYLLFGAFYLGWVTGGLSHLQWLADPWYRDRTRLSWALLVLGAIPGGVLLAAVAMGLGQVITRRRGGPEPTRRVRRWVAPAACVAIAVVAAALLRPPVRSESKAMQGYDPVRADYQAAFEYLRKHVGPHDRVLDDLRNHGDMWMYVDDDVPVLFGNAPLIGLAPDSWKERLYLRGELRYIRTNGCVRALIAKFHVRYVFYGRRRMRNGSPRIHLRTLENARYFRLVYTHGAARVFEIKPAPPGSPPASCRRVSDLLTRYPWDSLANAN